MVTRQNGDGIAHGKVKAYQFPVAFCSEQEQFPHLSERDVLRGTRECFAQTHQRFFPFF